MTLVSRVGESGVRRTTLNWILEGLAAWLLEPRLSAVLFLTGCRRLMDLAWKPEEQKFITAVNMENIFSPRRWVWHRMREWSATYEQVWMKDWLLNAANHGGFYLEMPDIHEIEQCHQCNNSCWCSTIFYAIKCQGSIETGWIHTLTPVGHRISPECTRTGGSIVSFSKKSNVWDHRCRNALHLRQTKYVWHSMEAVVNKKYTKDKQALELFQYKSSLRFCVPSYIFPFNGRCGPRGVTYSRHASGHCSKKTVNSHFSMCLLENVNHIGSLLPMGE